jgi:hypothetical protein
MAKQNKHKNVRLADLKASKLTFQKIYDIIYIE